MAGAHPHPVVQHVAEVAVQVATTCSEEKRSTMTSSTRGAEWLTADVATAVRRHMNADHVQDNTIIVRALGGEPAAEGAVLTEIDVDAAYFTVQVEGVPREVRIPWSAPLVDRPQIRAEVVRMYTQACELLGIAARGEGDH